MQNAISDFSFENLLEKPEAYEATLFLLGGINVQTILMSEGRLVEAIYLDVNPEGLLESPEPPFRRFLAFFPEEYELFDPAIFVPERKITLAGVFTGLRTGEIDDTSYVYPLFRIEAAKEWTEDPSWGYPPDWTYYSSFPTASPDIGYVVPPVASVPLIPLGSFPFLKEPDWVESSRRAGLAD